MRYPIFYMKMVTGEHVIAAAQYVTSQIIRLYHPFEIFIVNTSEGTGLKMGKWLPFSETEDSHLIMASNIIIIDRPKKEVLEYYKEILAEYNKMVSNSNDPEQEYTDEQIDEMQKLISNNNITVH